MHLAFAVTIWTTGSLVEPWSRRARTHARLVRCWRDLVVGAARHEDGGDGQQASAWRDAARVDGGGLALLATLKVVLELVALARLLDT